MNRDSYEGLPDDLKAVIDANSGIETSAWVGRVMDEGDAPARAIAVERGNTIATIDGAELERWQEAAEPVVASWIADMEDQGIDAQALIDSLAAILAEEEAR